MVQRVSVGESTLDGSNDTFGTDAKHVQKLLRFAALRHTGYGHPVHDDARLFTHCRQDGLAQTTYNDSTGTKIKYLSQHKGVKIASNRKGEKKLAFPFNLDGILVNTNISPSL